MVKNKLTGNSKLPKAPTGASYMTDVAGNWKPSKEQQERDRRYKAEDGLRTIQQADKVKSDKPLMKDIKALAKENMATLAKVAKGK